ncbi:MAG: methylated-DNA--[protein]-cysteine S-methyltransferase [Desulforhopalus sp.]
MKHYCFYQSPIGRLLLIGSEGMLEELVFPNSAEKRSLGEDCREDAAPFQEVVDQLNEYFAGKRHQFTLELAPKGTEYQLQVWQQLREIPYGETVSYGEIAARLGNPKGCRAVGMANSRNPIPIIVPCHRVVGKDGSLTGFGGGLEVKRQLLELEKRSSLP